MESAWYYQTSIGRVCISSNGKSITHLYFAGEKIPQDITVEETPLMREAGRQLIEYLDGKRRVFDIPLEMKGTDFQRSVWEALNRIPWGETRSYKDIAESMGNPKACRAVGMANNKNPLPIFIPCHRVVGANGKLVGYAGGLDIKEKLLLLEREKYEAR